MVRAVRLEARTTGKYEAKISSYHEVKQYR
jgi:hypothetical protein